MRALYLAFILLVAGCAETMESIGALDRAATEALYGDAALAGTLAPYPQSSGCTDPRCVELDRYEAQLYAAARSGRIKWIQLVDAFYLKRSQLFPSVPDTAYVRELRAFQRMLGEARDQGRVTETQWAYAIERKTNELRARYR